MTSGSEPTMLAKRQSLPAVKVISTHLFTLKYSLATKQKTSLSAGTIAGIAVGAAVAGLVIIGLLVFFFSRMTRRRRERRAAAAGAAFAASSGVASPMTQYSTHAPPSIFHGQTGMSSQYARSIPPDRTRSPISGPSSPSAPMTASPALHIAPMELPSTTETRAPPLPAPPPIPKSGSANRADSLERHPAYSPTGGNFK